MIWLTLAFCSAFFLGIYDICKKKAVHQNAVWPVLLICSLTNVFLLSFLGVPEIHSIKDHFILFVKAGIVTTSWGFTYNAIAKLPLSVTSPIRASAPIFTILMATLLMGERPHSLQWLGIASCLLGYFLFSSAGKKETGSYWKNPFVIFMFVGTFLASCSGIYDKFLLQNLAYDPLVLQFWFNVYMSIVQAIILFFYWRPRRSKQPFQFRPTMLLIGLLLLVADRFYFLSLHEQGALVSVVTIVRRSNVLIAFTAGLFLFKEKKSKRKWGALAAILLGLACIALGNF
ncbi:MAG: GRP family sugar transporter [Fibrobacteraceae bacterium]|nr:GRP family sugar transporter [Fibrobacteraceae bacterium]